MSKVCFVQYMLPEVALSPSAPTESSLKQFLPNQENIFSAMTDFPDEFSSSSVHSNTLAMLVAEQTAFEVLQTVCEPIEFHNERKWSISPGDCEERN